MPIYKKDLTKEMVAEYMGKGMHLDENVLEQLKEFFEKNAE